MKKDKELHNITIREKCFDLFLNENMELYKIRECEFIPRKEKDIIVYEYLENGILSEKFTLNLNGELEGEFLVNRNKEKSFFGNIKNKKLSGKQVILDNGIISMEFEP